LGNLLQARAELTEALTLAQQVQQPHRIARVLNSLGFLAHDEGDDEQACAHFREALTLFEQINSPEAEEPRDMLQRLGCAPWARGSASSR
jgi:hypothetical protein